MDSEDDAQQLVEYFRELQRLEEEGERAPMFVGPYTAMITIGALQLAARHPSMTEGQRETLRALVDQFRPWFQGTPGETVIDQGWMPS